MRQQIRHCVAALLAAAAGSVWAQAGAAKVGISAGLSGGQGGNDGDDTPQGPRSPGE